MQYVIDNWEAIAAVTVAVHGLALVIVNLTSTPKDNEALSKAYRLVEIFAGIFSPKVKETAK